MTGTDTTVYAATALSFLLENLGKPVVFTGSQVPLCKPYNDARYNLIMSLIFAASDTIPEVTIFFGDRLLWACRATKTDTHRLSTLDLPNLPPLATTGITIDKADHLILPPLRVHTKMDMRTLTLRLTHDKTCDRGGKRDTSEGTSAAALWDGEYAESQKRFYFDTF